MSDTYNGWKNYETWNVALWIQNDESFYNIAKDAARYRNPFDNFIASVESCGSQMTPDGVRWMDGTIDGKAINDMIIELAAGF